MSLLTTRRNLSNRTLIHFSHSTDRLFLLFRSRSFIPEILQGTLLQARIIEPYVIVSTIMSKFILVLDSTFTEDSIFESCTSTMLFLKLGVLRIY